MSGKGFEPHEHLHSLQADGRTVDYLEVKWRLVWLRRSHPDAQLSSEHVQLDREQAIFRATISIPGHGSATGYGSASSNETRHYVERAETRAVGRALLALGFGTEFGSEYVLEPDSRPASAPPAPGGPVALPAGVTVGPTGVTSLPPRLASAFAQARPIVDDPLPSNRPASSPPPADPPLVSPLPSPPDSEPASLPGRPASIGQPAAGRPAALRPTPAPPTAAPARSPATRREEAERTGRPAGRPSPRQLAEELDLPARLAGRPLRPPTARPATAEPLDDFDEEPAEVEDEPEADSDWTAFWRWARRRGFNNRDEIEQAINQSIRGRTPKELRTLLLNLED